MEQKRYLKVTAIILTLVLMIGALIPGIIHAQEILPTATIPKSGTYLTTDVPEETNVASDMTNAPESDSTEDALAMTAGEEDESIAYESKSLTGTPQYNSTGTLPSSTTGDPKSDPPSRSGTAFGDFVFDSTTGTITDYIGSGGDIVIPSEINGVTVQQIGQRAFNCYFCANYLTSVYIPDTVISIGKDAFYGNRLTSLVIPDSVTSIGFGAFGSNKLTNVDIPNSVTSIGGCAFSHNQLTSVVIPNSVTYVGNSAFYSNQLTSIVISDSLTYIGDSVFSNNQLTSVDIPNSVTSIEFYAFAYNKLTNVVIPNSVTYIGTRAFGNNQLTSINIPDSVTDIGLYAFTENKLTSVDIPSSVTRISKHAFSYNQLTSVVIPNSVTIIDIATFQHNELTSVIIPNSVTKIEEGAFYSNELTSVVIPNSVTYIGTGAFSSNKLTSIVIPDSVTDLSGFNNNQLTSVNIPNSVTSIGNSAFYNNKLTNIVITDSVTWIGHNAFTHNELTSITIPNSVTFIGREAFANNQLTGVEIPDSVTKICSKAFAANNLRSIKLSNNLKEIGENSFKNNNLSIIQLPSSINGILNEYGVVIVPSPSQSQILYYCFDPTVRTAETLLPPSIYPPPAPPFNLPNFNLGTGGETIIKGPKINLFGKEVDLFEIPFATEMRIGKMKYEYDNVEEKLKVTFGYDKEPLPPGSDGTYWKETYAELKEFVNCFGKKTDREFYNRFRRLRKDMKANNMKLDFDFENALGYVEFSTKNGKREFIEGGCFVLIKADLKLDYPLKPPIFFVRFGIEGSLQTGFKLVPKDSDTIDLLAEIEIKLAPYLGAVIKALIAEGEAGLKGELTGTLEMPKASLSEAFTLKLQASVYFKYKILGFAYKKEYLFPEVQLYPKSRMPSVRGLSEADFSLIPRSTGSHKLRGSPSSAFAANVHAYCEPQLVSLSDGRRLMLWIGDAPDRSDANRTILQYSVYDGESWSLPQPVEDDGTVDFEPRLVSDGTNAYLLWQNGTQIFDDTVTLEEMASGIDLRYARYDGSTFTNITPITSSNTVYESNPRLAVHNGEVSVIWQENSEDDVFGSSGTNSLHRRQLNDGVWNDRELLVSDVGFISSAETAYDGAVNVVAYTAKTGDDLELMEDMELFYIEGSTHQRLTNDTSTDYSVSFLQAGDQVELYWCSDLVVKYIAGGNISDITELDFSLGVSNTDIQVIANDYGDKAILWEHPKDFGSELYVSYYDVVDDLWTPGVKVDTVVGKLRNWSSYLDDNFNLHTAYGLATIIDDTGTSEPFGATDLYFHTFSRQYDLHVEDVLWTETPILPEAEIELLSVVSNTGELPVNGLTVKVYAGDTLLDTHTLSQRIEVGESVDISIPYTLPSTITTQTLDVKILPYGVTDRDETDNIGSFSYGYSDLMMEDITEVITPTGREIHVMVRNRGYESAGAVTLNLHKDDMHGELLDTDTVISLGGGESVNMVVSVPSSYLDTPAGDIGRLFYLELSTDSLEENYGNNSDIVLLSGVELSLGDATADGLVNIYDIMAVRDHLVGRYLLSGSQFRSGDMTGDGEINILDLLAIKDHILGNDLADPSDKMSAPDMAPMIPDSDTIPDIPADDAVGEQSTEEVVDDIAPEKEETTVDPTQSDTEDGVEATTG
jgi:hypothetical protein